MLLDCGCCFAADAGRCPLERPATGTQYPRAPKVAKDVHAIGLGVKRRSAVFFAAADSPRKTWRRVSWAGAGMQCRQELGSSRQAKEWLGLDTGTRRLHWQRGVATHAMRERETTAALAQHTGVRGGNCARRHQCTRGKPIATQLQARVCRGRGATRGRTANCAWGRHQWSRLAGRG